METTTSMSKLVNTVAIIIIQMKWTASYIAKYITDTAIYLATLKQ